MLSTIKGKIIELFTITGNDAIDLLHVIQYFQKLEISLIIIFSYNLFLFSINESKLEYILLKVFPTKLVKFYIKSLLTLKKTRYIIIPCFLILILAANLYSYYYLDFYITNLDKIIEVYFSK